MWLWQNTWYTQDNQHKRGRSALAHGFRPWSFALFIPGLLGDRISWRWECVEEKTARLMAGREQGERRKGPGERYPRDLLWVTFLLQLDPSQGSSIYKNSLIRQEPNIQYMYVPSGNTLLNHNRIILVISSPFAPGHMELGTSGPEGTLKLLYSILPHLKCEWVPCVMRSLLLKTWCPVPFLIGLIGIEISLK